MRKFILYFVVALFAAFNAGMLLLLKKDQYEARKHALKPLGDDVYEVLGRVEFKKGEIIGLCGELSKYDRTVLKPVHEEDVPPEGSDIRDGEEDLNELIALAEELGLKKAHKKSREKLIKFIEDHPPVQKEENISDDQRELDDLGDQELVTMATELGIENAAALDRQALISVIIDSMKA